MKTKIVRFSVRLAEQFSSVCRCCRARTGEKHFVTLQYIKEEKSSSTLTTWEDINVFFYCGDCYETIRAAALKVDLDFKAYAYLSYLDEFIIEIPENFISRPEHPLLFWYPSSSPVSRSP